MFVVLCFLLSTFYSADMHQFGTEVNTLAENIKQSHEATLPGWQWQQEELNIATDSSLSQLSLQSSEHPTQPGPSVHWRHVGPGGGPQWQRRDGPLATWTCFNICKRQEGRTLGVGYLSLGSPQHVLLFLKDSVHSLKELCTLLGNPAKKRELMTTLKIEIKHLENVNIWENKCVCGGLDQCGIRMFLDSN